MVCIVQLYYHKYEISLMTKPTSYIIEFPHQSRVVKKRTWLPWFLWLSLFLSWISSWFCNQFHILLLHSRPHCSNLWFNTNFGLKLNWIRSRTTLRYACTHKCLKCHIFWTHLLQPLISDVPDSLVTSSHPVNHVGTDFASLVPVETLLASKVMLAFFTTKPVHSEFLSNYWHLH